MVKDEMLARALKALETIEGMCLTDDEQDQKIPPAVYHICHVARGPACNHPDWEKEFNAIHEALKGAGVI